MFQLQGNISKLGFGYNAKMGGYANMSSDTLKLGDNELFKKQR